MSMPWHCVLLALGSPRSCRLMFLLHHAQVICRSLAVYQCVSFCAQCHLLLCCAAVVS